MEKYHERSVLMLSDVINHKYKELTKEQCKVISECFAILTKDNITKKEFSEIDDKLQNVELDWMDTSICRNISEVLVESNGCKYE